MIPSHTTLFREPLGTLSYGESLMGQLATLAPPAVAEERLVPSPPATILPRDDVDGPWFIYFIAI